MAIANPNNPNNKIPNIIAPMLMGDNGLAIYDEGFYNIGVTPTFEDIGRGGKGPTGSPLSSSRQRLFAELGLMAIPFDIIGGATIRAITDLGQKVCADRNKNGFCGLNEKLKPAFHRVAVDGAMKVPGLRMVDLTGPYFHNGTAATLKQVIEFYNNGGNFCNTNLDNLDPDITPLGLTAREKNDLVKFLLSLNDTRVKQESNHFDHPSLLIADNGLGDNQATTIEIPAVGRKGRASIGLPPLRTFLDLNQQKAGKAPMTACVKRLP